MMDRFTKYALVIMFAAVGFIILSTYIGVFVFGGDMATKYIVIMEEQAEEENLPVSHVIELDELGEYIGFTIAGAVGGLIVGYLIPSIFEQNHAPLRRKE